MKLGQKTLGNRYCIYAKRNKNENWSDWSQTNELDRAMEHLETIRNCGFLAKLVNKETKEVLISDGSKKVS